MKEIDLDTNDNSKENLNEIVSLSIKAKKEVADSFREESSSENIPQGEFLDKLLKSYFRHKMVKEKLLIKPLKGKCKTITFSGKLIYSTNYRYILTNLHDTELGNLISKADGSISPKELKFIKFILNVYEVEEGKYLIYEQFNGSKEGTYPVIDIKYYDIADNQDDLIKKSQYKLFLDEFNQMLFNTLEEEALDI